MPRVERATYDSQLIFNTSSIGYCHDPLPLPVTSYSLPQDLFPPSHKKVEKRKRNSQFPINVYPLPHAHLHLADALAGLDAPVPIILLDRRLELVAPRAAPAVPVAVVVAQQVVPARLLAPSHLERLVDGAQEVFGQVRRERAQPRQVGGGL